MKQNEQFILKILLLYVIVQPLFDILSFLSIKSLIPIPISTYVKPLIVFTIAIYVFFNFCKEKKPWIFFSIAYAILAIVHLLLLKNIGVNLSTIFHEFRFMINIFYMVALFFSFYTLIKSPNIDDKEVLKAIKLTVFYTMLLYCILLLIAVLTSTSGMTYGYADPNKLGYKGWFDSGQILGHALSVTFPLNLYMILSPKNSWYKKVLLLGIFLTVASLLGTKVPYIITLTVLILDLIISLLIVFINKKHKFNLTNIILLVISIILMLGTYKYTPVAYNTKLNNFYSKKDLSSYDIKKINGSTNVSKTKPIKGTKADKYNVWSIRASEHLNKLFQVKKINPSNTRKIQYAYFLYKFKMADFKYKLFGLGYLNHKSNFAIESDFFMSLFCFGIIGFTLMIFLPLMAFIAITIFIIKNLKIIDLEMYLMYMGIGEFFCISICAGYTYIYTNFSIFLVLLFIMLGLKKIQIEKEKNNSLPINKNKVSFLLLHLGYGGIETATINTANALSETYEVELVSFYNLQVNQSSKINSNIKIKYLYDGEPNKKELKQALTKLKAISFIKESCKALTILIKKKTLIKKEIINTDAKYLISTRVEFSTLLSKYGRTNIVKIAQEHHHHNNDKNYIHKLKYYYYNIDYLLALTESLKKDYQRFLKHNHHTKVILIPNMLTEIPSKKSDLNNYNFITISRLDKNKKEAEIIKMFSKIPNKATKLLIIGDGPEMQNLESLITSLHLNKRVKLYGYLSQKQIAKYFYKSSIFLMASVTEGLPMVLLEAMSYGLPCIAFETSSGTKDIINDNINGFIIKNRNEQEYISKCNEIISNKTEKIKFSKQALKKVNSFYKDNVVKKWKEILK